MSKARPLYVLYTTATMAVAALPSCASAQEVPQVITPPKVMTDPNNLNLLTGKALVPRPSLSIPAAPRLTYTRGSDFMIYVDGQQKVTDPATTGGQAFYTVHYGGYRSESFTCGAVDDPSAPCSPNSSYSRLGVTVGTTTASGTFTKDNSGETYSFNKVARIYTDQLQLVKYSEILGNKIQYPDGETLWITYDLYDPSDQLSTRRLNTVQSSTGYYLKLTYQAANWGQVETAAIYANADATTPLAKFEYSADGKQITDLAGKTWSCSISCDGDAFSRPWRANDATTLPGETSASVLYTPDSTNPFLTQTITHDGVAYSYSYGGVATFEPGLGDNGDPKSFKFDSLSVTGPDGYHRTYAMQTVTNPASWGSPYQRYEIQYVKSSTDELNRTTNYTFEPFGDSKVPGWRLTGITHPEMNSEQFAYDAAGNIITRTESPKPGVATSALVQQAQYGSSGVNAWRPLWYRDARGDQTDFVYNAGGLLTQQLDPPDADGVRRRTIIEYEQFQPSTLVPAGQLGSGNPAPTIYRKTKVRICGVLATNTGICVTDEPYTTYAYQGDTQLPTVVTQVDASRPDSDPLKRRTTVYSYDPAGRLASADGPLSGTADARYFRYDLAGRKTWEIGELAANGRRLTKEYYYRDADDKVYRTINGYTSCPSACDTAAFTRATINTTDIAYDSRRYDVRELTRYSTNRYAVTDRSFLDRGLPDCVAVRMNLAALPAATATGACTLGTEGTDGPDRITRNTYNAAGELTKVQKGYGTSLVADYATYTYTPNGKQEYVTDANGNEARFLYDGFDRLAQWQFPSKTTAGSVNTADYEQYGYDPVGNRTCLRKRDGSVLTFTYDAPNRVTSKVVTATGGGVCP